MFSKNQLLIVFLLLCFFFVDCYNRRWVAASGQELIFIQNKPSLIHWRNQLIPLQGTQYLWKTIKGNKCSLSSLRPEVHIYLDSTFEFSSSIDGSVSIPLDAVEKIDVLKKEYSNTKTLVVILGIFSLGAFLLIRDLYFHLQGNFWD